jgi:endonuclease/exonuclease/phosphatase family metal-dependent hydrolase
MPPRRRRRARILPLLLGLLCGPAAAATPAAPEPALEVATLNTWGLPYPVSAIAPRERFPRIERYLDRIDADIVGLQEVWRGARRLLRVPGLHLRESPHDTGLALVSPHPVRAMHEARYTEGRGVDRLKTKGVIWAEVDTPAAGRVSVFVTHLQAGPGPDNAAVRAAQVSQLLTHTRTTALPAVLLGDFNFDPDEPADRAAAGALAAAGFADAAAQIDREAATHPGDGHRYDRVYLRSGLRRALHARAARVDATPPEGPLSDHLPLRVEVSVEPAQ